MGTDDRNKKTILENNFLYYNMSAINKNTIELLQEVLDKYNKMKVEMGAYKSELYLTNREALAKNLYCHLKEMFKEMYEYGDVDYNCPTCSESESDSESDSKSESE